MSKDKIQVAKKQGLNGRFWVVIDTEMTECKTINFYGGYKTKKECLQAVEQHRKLMNKILKR